jgi:hypothetical protein
MLDMRRLCARCGSEIAEHKRADAVYCSGPCQKAAYQAFVSADIAKAKAGRCCKWCGASMPAGFTSRREFCSRKCQRRGHRAREKAARPVQTCPACLTGFQATSPRQTYCSWSCAQGHGYRAGAAIDCQQCGIQIETPRLGQKFCNPLCRGRWHRHRRKACPSRTRSQTTD